MSEHILSVNNVTMQFGGVIAVDDLSMYVDEGEIVALIGPNGAGKTTAFNCITGVYEPTNGSIDFLGETIAANHPQGAMRRTYMGDPAELETRVVINSPDKITRRGIARTFQNIRLFSNLSVLDNVLIAKHMRAKQNFFTATLRLNYKEERRMLTESLELLEMQDMLELKDEIAGSLPYGVQRRLEIARALATKPKLLMLDEPAAGMNPQETDDLTDFIRRIKEEHDLTVFLIEHHMDLVMDISDRIYVLDFGHTIAHGTPEQVQNDPEVIKAYLGVQE